jgi:hypothetical protein
MPAARRGVPAETSPIGGRYASRSAGSAGGDFADWRRYASRSAGSVPAGISPTIGGK